MRLKRILGILPFVFLITSAPQIPASNIVPTQNDNLFLQEFLKALNTKDQAKMEQLIREESPDRIYHAIITQAYEGINSVAEGKDGSLFFMTAEAISEIYGKVSEKSGLLTLVRNYKAYVPEMCREKLKGDSLIDEGAALYEKQQWKEALNRWTEAMKIFQRLVDWNGLSRTLNNMGAIYGLLGQYSEAVNYYQQGLEITRRIDNRGLEATILMNIGQDYWKMSEYEQFLNSNLEALKLNQKMGRKDPEMRGLRNIAQAYLELKQFDQALDYYQRALGLAEELGNLGQEAQILNETGLIYFEFEQFEQAANYHRQALRIAERINDTKEEAYSLGNIGKTLLKLRQYRDAHIYSEKAMDKFREIGDLGGEITAHINIAKSLYGIRLYADTLETYQEVLKKIRKTKNAPKEAEVLETLGMVYKQLGEYQKALDHYDEALKMFKEINDKGHLANTLMEIGTVHENTGRYALALDFYQQSFAILRDVKDTTSQAAVLGNMGMVYKKLGRYREALYYSEEAFKKVSDSDIEGKATLNLAVGNIYDILGDYSKALHFYDQSFELYYRSKDIVGVSKALGNKANIQKKLDQYERALSSYQLVLESNRKISDLRGEAATLLNLGNLYGRLSQYSEAIPTLQEAVKISERLGDLETFWRSNIALGQALWASGKEEAAVEYYNRGIGIIEEIYEYTKGLQEEARSSVMDDKTQVYKELVELLLELHQESPDKDYDKQAFLISEKSKSRAFQELMAKARAKIAFAEEAKDETFKKMIERERRLIGELANLQSLLPQEISKPEKQRNEEVIKSLKEQLAKTEKNFQAHEKEIDTQYPRYADLKRPKPLTVEGLQEILRPDETVLAYSVGENLSVAFVIGKTKFKLYEMSIKRNELVDLVRKLRAGLDDISDYSDLAKFDPVVSYTLYQKLLAPLAPDLQGIKKLYLTADDVLYTLPFEVLVDRPIDQNAFGGVAKKTKAGTDLFLGEYGTLHYLVDTYTISYLPSASVLRSLRMYEKLGYGKWQPSLIAYADPIFSEEEEKEGAQGIKGKGIVKKGLNQDTVFSKEIVLRSTGGSGDLPRLTDSADEARIIAREVRGKERDIYLRDKATEENVRTADLRKARYVLFSTHGLLGGDFSGVAEPALALTLVGNPPGTDGFFTMSEVLGLDMNAEMVILSACNTSGRGDKAGRGEGFAGLTRSFMYAGTKSILVTHWSVDSEAAKDLMVEMFRNMKRQPRPEALREAKLKMKASVRDIDGIKVSLSHPFFWAPFVLVGESH